MIIEKFKSKYRIESFGMFIFGIIPISVAMLVFIASLSIGILYLGYYGGLKFMCVPGVLVLFGFLIPFCLVPFVLGIIAGYAILIIEAFVVYLAKLISKLIKLIKK